MQSIPKPRTKLSEDQVKGSLAKPGGLLQSKPTWWITRGYSTTSAFFFRFTWSAWNGSGSDT